MSEQWTTSRYFGFIRNVLRGGFKRYPNKYKVLANAKVGRGKYRCNSCNKTYKAKEVSVDHIKPCGKLLSYDDLPEFVSTLFCAMDNLQVLCNECHKYKTLTDRGMTDEDIQVSEFKKLKAAEQRKIVPGKNLAERIANYRKTL